MHTATERLTPAAEQMYATVFFSWAQELTPGSETINTYQV